MIMQFFLAFMSTVGFGVLFNIPKNAIIKSAFAGGFGWLTYISIHSFTSSLVFSSFIGACVVAIISEIFARRFKEAVTVFVIPGILPLVPGSGMYHTMLAIIQQDFNQAALVGSETLFVAGSIAASILLVSSITRLVCLKKI